MSLWSTTLEMAGENGGGGTDPSSRDFAISSAPPSASPFPATAHHAEDPSGSGGPGNSHLYYPPSIDTGLASTARGGSTGASVKAAHGCSDTEAAMSPSMRRRPTRVGTFKTVDDFDDFTVPRGWHRMSSPEPHYNLKLLLAFPSLIALLTSATPLQPALNRVWIRANRTAAMPPWQH